MKLEDFYVNYPHHYRSDLRWGEMDAMQHLNNVYYFRYFESARMAFWEGLQNHTRNQVPSSIGPILASTSCRYRRPLYYPDHLIVGTRIHSIERDRFLVAHAIFSEEEQNIAADGEALIVSFDYALKKKVVIPEAWKDFLSSTRSDMD